MAQCIQPAPSLAIFFGELSEPFRAMLAKTNRKGVRQDGMDGVRGRKGLEIVGSNPDGLLLSVYK